MTEKVTWAYLLKTADHYDWLGSIAMNEASMAEDDFACIDEARMWYDKADAIRARTYELPATGYR